MSIASDSITHGVIQPPQTLLRGKRDLSRTKVCNPDERSPQAQDDPAGPPPTINTSQDCIQVPVAIHGRWRTNAHGSVVRSGNPFRQTPIEIVGECQREKLQLNQQDINATFWQIPVRSGVPPDHRSVQMTPASIPESLHNEVEDFQHPTR